MEEFMNFMNDILKNRVQDVYQDHGNEKQIMLSPMSTVLSKVGVEYQCKEEQEVKDELMKMSKKKKSSPFFAIFIPVLAGFVFYYFWLDSFLGLQNEVVKLLMTMVFTDIVFAIYGYFNYTSSVKQIQKVFGEVHCEVSKKVMNSDHKILTRLHIPLPDAKMESYQNICRLLKKNQIVFPEDVQDVREEINYLKQRQEDGVFEIRQDELCVICPQMEDAEENSSNL